jgi:hypothetical protein
MPARHQVSCPKQKGTPAYTRSAAALQLDNVHQRIRGTENVFGVAIPVIRKT